MTGEQEPWWRAEYDRCVAAYRIDDPVLDVAAACLANGSHPDRDTPPGHWAVSADVA